MKLEILSAALLASLVAGCAREELHLIEKTEHFEQGEWVFQGISCMQLSTDGGDQMGWETGIAGGGNEDEYIHNVCSRIGGGSIKGSGST